MEHATGTDVAIPHTLPDGAPVLLRPVVPGDRERLRAGFERLSEKTKFQRFFRGIRRLSDEDLDYLTRVDQVHHVAWAVIDPSSPSQAGLALGRFVRDRENPEVAEVAFVVIDAWHHRGIGKVLLAVLLARAAELGVRMLRAVVRPDNDPMLVWMRSLGAPESGVDGLVREFSLAVGAPISTTPAARSLDRLRRDLRVRLRRARRRNTLRFPGLRSPTGETP